MRYEYFCERDGPYAVDAPIDTGPPDVVECPICSEIGTRVYNVPSVIYGEGFSKDYFDKNPGRGQPWDKKEWLNKNWSEHYGEAPPKADSKGTYDGS